MLRVANDFLEDLFGLDKELADVSAGEMALRTILVYLAMLALVRLASKRFLGEATAFDTVVAITLGSVLSRAINGSAPLLPTIAAGAVILGIHWFFAFLSYRTDWFGGVVKGNRVVLIEKGEPKQMGLRRTYVTKADLEEALRLQLNQSDPTEVEHAYLERNGRISFVRRKGEPRVVEVSVAAGVQTVRIELE